MLTQNQMVPVLKPLKMSGLLETLQLRIDQAVDEKLPYLDFLHRVLSDELQRRENKKLDNRLRKAEFEGERTLEGFDFTFNPKLPRERIIDLGSCAFVDRKENIVLVGPTGVGKSHIAQAIGHKACRRGNTVLYTQANKLLASIRAARGMGDYDKHLAKLQRVQLLVIDDLGLVPLSPEEAGDLYELIRLRYEVAATVFTSNRAIEEWYPLFGDKLLASAAMDRLLHHSSVLILEGDSYRNPPNKNARKERN